MKKISLFVLLLFCFCLYGCCSIPRTKSYTELYSFTREKKKIKRKFASTSVKLVRDFRENECYEQNITALKTRIEKYISSHPDLDSSSISNLRDLKVTEGSTQDEVRLLLGQPDKDIKLSTPRHDSSRIWIYNISKPSVFTVVFLPVFFGHEKYYLYFKEDILNFIERHYLEQTFYTSDSNMGLKASSGGK